MFARLCKMHFMFNATILLHSQVSYLECIICRDREISNTKDHYICLLTQE